jgi:hypothetical protein
MQILGRLAKHPDIRILKQELDTLNNNDAWPTDLKVTLGDTVKYRGLKMRLSINFDRHHFNGEGIEAVIAKESEWITNPDHEYPAPNPGEVDDRWCKCGMEPFIVLTFPQIGTPKKYTRNEWNFDKREYVKNTGYQTTFDEVPITAVYSIENLFNQLKEGHKEYLQKAAVAGKIKDKVERETAEEAAAKKKEEAAKKKKKVKA